MTGLPFHAEVNVKKLGKCEEHGATSTVFYSGAIMQHVIVAMRPTGVVGLKFVTSPVASPHSFSESTFGPFLEETPLGRLDGEVKGLTVDIPEVLSQRL